MGNKNILSMSNIDILSKYLSKDNIEIINYEVKKYLLEYNLYSNKILNISFDNIDLKNNIFIYSFFIYNNYKFYILNIYNIFNKHIKLYIICNNKLEKYIDTKNNIEVRYTLNNYIFIAYNKYNYMKYKLYNNIFLKVCNNFITKTYCNKTYILKHITLEKYDICCSFYYKNYNIYYFTNYYQYNREIRKYKNYIFSHDIALMNSYLSLYKLNYNIDHII